jgi:hypothetical protein
MNGIELLLLQHHGDVAVSPTGEFSGMAVQHLPVGVTKRRQGDPFFLENTRKVQRERAAASDNPYLDRSARRHPISPPSAFVLLVVQWIIPSLEPKQY